MHWWRNGGLHREVEWVEPRLTARREALRGKGQLECSCRLGYTLSEGVAAVATCWSASMSSEDPDKGGGRFNLSLFDIVGRWTRSKTVKPSCS